MIAITIPGKVSHAGRIAVSTNSKTAWFSKHMPGYCNYRTITKLIFLFALHNSTKVLFYGTHDYVLIPFTSLVKIRTGVQKSIPGGTILHIPPRPCCG